MKKLFTLLLLTITAFTFKAGAQNTTCSADFTFAISGLSVTFTPAITTTASTSHNYWSFGDGNISSDISPVHVYASAGNYTVKHVYYRAENGVAVCVDSVKKTVAFNTTANNCYVHAHFLFQRDPSQPNKFIFTNASAWTGGGDTLKVKWSFGDGTYSSDFNTSHVYALSGVYTVCLTLVQGNCHQDTCAQIQVQVSTPPVCNLTAYFAFHADSLQPNKIHFINYSSPFESKDSIWWTFGDGTSSTDINPTHTYTSPGTYNVCIRVKKATASSATSCVKEFCKQVVIIAPEVSCGDASKFTFTRSTVNCLEFKFVPVNQNPNWKYVWSFGDGTGSNDMLPAGHVYPHSGNYTVYLTISRPTCVATSHQLVETGACFSCNNIWVKYEYRKESASSNKFFFHALSNAPILSQKWSITKLNVSGAATISLSELNPDYTFIEPGDYRVCLHVVTSGNCVKEYCEVIHIIAPNTECTLTAFPNPASNQVTFTLQLTQPVVMHVYIYNSLNILVRQKEQQGFTGNNVITTNVEGLVPGLYSVKVIYGNRICYSKFQKL